MRDVGKDSFVRSMEIRRDDVYSRMEYEIECIALLQSMNVKLCRTFGDLAISFVQSQLSCLPFMGTIGVFTFCHPGARYSLYKQWIREDPSDVKFIAIRNRPEQLAMFLYDEISHKPKQCLFVCRDTHKLFLIWNRSVLYNLEYLCNHQVTWYRCSCSRCSFLTMVSDRLHYKYKGWTLLHTGTWNSKLSEPCFLSHFTSCTCIMGLWYNFINVWYRENNSL
jgi:hypothetical protein